MACSLNFVATFIQQDIDNITETINLLSSENQENVDKGMDRVANILPFLLLGGFSKSEVISYLKAKLEAAKSVMTGVDKKQEDEDTMVERTEEKKEAHGQIAMHEELPGSEEQKSVPGAIAQENKEEVDISGDGGENTPPTIPGS